MIEVNCECGEGSATFDNILMGTDEVTEFTATCDACDNDIKIEIETNMV